VELCICRCYQSFDISQCMEQTMQKWLSLLFGQIHTCTEFCVNVAAIQDNISLECHQRCRILHTCYITQIDVIRQSNWRRGKHFFQAVTPEPGQREKIMKRKVGRKTVKRRKERIAGTNKKRRQSSLRAARPTADAIGSVFACINKSAVNEFLNTHHPTKILSYGHFNQDKWSFYIGT